MYLFISNFEQVKKNTCHEKVKEVKTINVKCFQKNVNMFLNKKTPEYITEEIEISFDDSYREVSDEENPNEEDSDEKKFIEEN